MLRLDSLRGASAVAILLGAGLAAGAAQAQDANEVAEVIVTGSYIRGTPEDAALPVDVLSAQVGGKAAAKPATTRKAAAKPAAKAPAKRAVRKAA